MAEIKSTGSTALPKSGMYTNGKTLVTVHAAFALATGDIAAGDILVLAEDVTLAGRVHRVIARQAIAADATLTDNDLGFYMRKADGSLVALDAGVELLVGEDLSGGVALGTDLIALGAADRTKTVAELAGVNRTDAYSDIVLGLKVNADPTNELNLDLDIVIEKPTV